ncbi:MarR family winged helix-turn-helix transcriptional regulator [Paenactinomyces guangxiensis]|uniref:Winged helix-turn-helix transcriptional regulator n=1 Tax=Paenactinomyces guangxiensis TaxID=1490290 RepID=A0A7W2A855_9BACL|nr:MarR family winged helix-turn-helix transcriptional regulator [Paenactinomyces guangxiensis]MBA4494300.1 winged helix-turn-helix transcriptional regulator [Paenactinomyces guangxiensis]MBH8590794.1 winged helix-turn-helix transcriptional regulator [Paenactinomyces guangxiensis]
MDSIFDLSKQQQDLDSKIVVALERIAQAFKTLLWKEAIEYNLSPIQIQILVHIYHHRHLQCTVSQLAGEFIVSRATISEAAKSLLEKKLIVRTPSDTDRRISILELTSDGEKLAGKLSHWASIVQLEVISTASCDKETVMLFLMNLIHSLQQAGLISTIRMCMTCKYFQRDADPGSDAPHYCHLINQPLLQNQLRMDCPEHKG